VAVRVRAQRIGAQDEQGKLANRCDPRIREIKSFRLTPRFDVLVQRCDAAIQSSFRDRERTDTLPAPVRTQKVPPWSCSAVPTPVQVQGFRHLSPVELDEELSDRRLEIW